MTDAILRTEALTKSFGGVRAVDGVDLSITEGEITSLIGPNGAGKTTCFNMLSGALEPTSGQVLFQDDDITGLEPEAIARRGLGRSFQITNVFAGLSVLDNVRVAVQARYEGGWNFYRHIDSKPAYREEALEILEYVGLHDLRDQPADTLSHGDKRSLEIGLVLAIEPEMLLLDEPTAGMSQGEIDEALDLINDLAEDYTILLVEHNMDIVMNISDTVVVLANGQVIAEGDPSAIQSNEDVQEAYLGGVA
ncbi:MAG: ABC transporter ATP-binding protein [Haloarculaceae archaeon]